MAQQYNINETLFKIIRRKSKFCSVCGETLDLPYRDWHLPFCNKCRKEIIGKIRDEARIIKGD